MGSLFQELTNLYHKVKDFITHGIWKVDLKQLNWYRRVLIKTLRTFSLAYRGFNEDKVNLRASALTFYSILSVVPILAMGFGVAKGFGFEEKLKLILEQNLKGQEEVATWLIDFAGNMLNSVQGGWIFGIGLVFLFWTVMQVLGNIENAFNSIWQVKRSRYLFRKFSDYLAIMLIAPVLVLLSSSSQVFIIEWVDRMTTDVNFFGYVGPVLYSFVQLIPFIIVWLLFLFIYMVMPNIKVNFASALLAGIIAGTAFQFLQWGYIHFQIGVSRYNAIYGSFAALPLFLVWLHWSWLIVLFGAEISFSAQNHYQYEYETEIKGLNLLSKQKISLYLLHTVVKNFEEGLPPLTAQQLSMKLKIPVRLVRHLLYEMVECRIIVETTSMELKEPAFMPGRDISNLTIDYVLNALNLKGIEFSFHEEALALSRIENCMAGFQKSIESSAMNGQVKDLTKGGIPSI